VRSATASQPQVSFAGNICVVEPQWHRKTLQRARTLDRLTHVRWQGLRTPTKAARVAVPGAMKPVRSRSTDQDAVAQRRVTLKLGGN
jgi:hypothetical protein